MEQEQRLGLRIAEGPYRGVYKEVDDEPQIGDLIQYKHLKDTTYYVKSKKTQEVDNLTIIASDNEELVGTTAIAGYPFDQHVVLRRDKDSCRPGMLVEVVNACPTPMDIDEGKEYKNGDIFEVGTIWGDGVSYGGITTTQNLDLADYEIRPYEAPAVAESSEQVRLFMQTAQMGASTPNPYEAFTGFGTHLQDSLDKVRERLVEQHVSYVGDAVEHPSHYKQGKFETIEVIEEITQGYEDGYVAYCVGNALKYLARAPHKHDTPTEDCRKAAKYLEFALERLDR